MIESRTYRFKLFFIIALIAGVTGCTSGPSSENHPEETAESAPEPTRYAYGLPLDSFHVIEGRIKPGDNLGALLLPYGVSYATLDRITREYADVFNFNRIRADHEYLLFCTPDSVKNARCFIYEISPEQYVKIELGDSLGVVREKRPVELRERSASGYIAKGSSLSMALDEQGLPPALANDLSVIYAWTIDFFHLQPGDRFRLIYDERYVDDERIGVGRIKAAQFVHLETDFYGFYFEDTDSYGDYFDENGDNLRRAFLRAPLEFGRISSRYNKNRVHPVLRVRRAHLGTDYAAPTGTPILSTADGEIIAMSYTRGNGNYVKIRHNSTYTTQYLHMSKFNRKLKVGMRVRQGDVIGYVGSTGLATGPHVCYRFWKNGVQVDPLKENLPKSEPVQHRDQFEDTLRVWKPALDAIEIPIPASE